MYRDEYADALSINAESTYVNSGLEREFTDLLGEAQKKFALAIVAKQCNLTCLEILINVNADFVFAEKGGISTDPLAFCIRSQIFY